MYKNTADQKLRVYAHNTGTDSPATGDAANITAQISKDGGACAPSDDANPTELDATNAPGVYLFDLSAAETDADQLVVCAQSSTANVHIEPAFIDTVALTASDVAILTKLRKWLTNSRQVDATDGNKETIFDDDDETPYATITPSEPETGTVKETVAFA